MYSKSDTSILRIEISDFISRFSFLKSQVDWWFKFCFKFRFFQASNLYFLSFQPSFRWLRWLQVHRGSPLSLWCFSYQSVFWFLSFVEPLTCTCRSIFLFRLSLSRDLKLVESTTPFRSVQFQACLGGVFGNLRSVKPLELAKRLADTDSSLPFEGYTSCFLQLSPLLIPQG